MATNTIVWIVIAVITALVWVARNKQVSRRHAQAEETAARARAAQAEARAARRGERAARRGERRRTQRLSPLQIDVLARSTHALSAKRRFGR